MNLEFSKKIKNNINPHKFDSAHFYKARFLITKRYSVNNIYQSIKYGIFCSTQSDNKKFNHDYRDRNGEEGIYLFLNVNEFLHLCKIAEMKSRVYYEVKSGVWFQDKCHGKIYLRWLYIKDVPNRQVRNIHL